jgi:TRAP-type C4-dicarboxylate transport system permease small subunit
MKQSTPLENKKDRERSEADRRVHGAQRVARALGAANRCLINTEKGLVYGAAVIVLGMMLLTVSEITSRKLIGYSMEGVFEGIELMLVAIVYFGVAHAQFLGKHVRVEILVTRVPFKLAQTFDAFTMFLALIFFSLAFWLTGKQAWNSWLIRESTMLPAALPIWAARGMVTVGISFLWIRLLIQIGEKIYNLFENSGKSGNQGAMEEAGRGS